MTFIYAFSADSAPDIFLLEFGFVNYIKKEVSKYYYKVIKNKETGILELQSLTRNRITIKCHFLELPSFFMRI